MSKNTIKIGRITEMRYVDGGFYKESREHPEKHFDLYLNMDAVDTLQKYLAEEDSVNETRNKILAMIHQVLEYHLPKL